MNTVSRLSAFIGCAGLALALSASGAISQVPVDACNPPDSEFNHLECYKVTEDSGLIYNFDLVVNDTDFLPANTLEKGCSLRRKADSVCIDVRTKNIDPKPVEDVILQCGDGTPCSTDNDCQVGFCMSSVRTSVYGPIPNSWDYVCYKIKCDRQSQPGPGTIATVKDRFGERNLKVRRSWKVCMPILDKP